MTLTTRERYLSGLLAESLPALKEAERLDTEAVFTHYPTGGLSDLIAAIEGYLEDVRKDL